MLGSQKFSQHFHFLEMQSDSENYVSEQDDKITELVHYIGS